MTVHVSDATSARRLSLSQKLAVASGAAAAIAGVAAPQAAEAGIVESTTLPMSPPASSGYNVWDVDGDGTNDFELSHLSSSTRYAILTALGPARFVSPAARASDGFAKLNAGFNVGGSMTAGYKFLSSPQAESVLPPAGTTSRRRWCARLGHRRHRLLRVQILERERRPLRLGSDQHPWGNRRLCSGSGLHLDRGLLQQHA
jgi:hypothetical protein